MLRRLGGIRYASIWAFFFITIFLLIWFIPLQKLVFFIDLGILFFLTIFPIQLFTLPLQHRAGKMTQLRVARVQGILHITFF